jgi:uridine phosphorylase
MAVSLNNVNKSSKPSADNLFHLGLNSQRDNLPKMFGDVKFFLTGGAASRMQDLATKIAASLPPSIATEGLQGPIGSTERFEMYKVGPVLLCNHGMGIPSTSIMLHEITKLLHHAGADDPVFIRLGTSGGVGVPPGTVVITTEGVNGMLEPVYTLPILGEPVSRPTTLDPNLAAAIIAANGSSAGASFLMQGRTMSTDCFYEGQGRIDGAICQYTEEDKLAWLTKIQAAGVLNMEMEVQCTATHSAQCTAITNARPVVPRMYRAPTFTLFSCLCVSGDPICRFHAATGCACCCVQCHAA